MVTKINIITSKFLAAIRLLLSHNVKTYVSDDQKTLCLTSGNDQRPETPRIIWIYWHTDSIPSLVQACITNIRNLNPEFTVNVLSKNNVDHFLPDLKFIRDDLNIQLQSDIIRLELLFKYGGIWVDASVVFFENIQWVTNLSAEKRFDLIGFYRRRLTNDLSCPIIENWFLCSPPDNAIIGNWLKIFRPAMELGLSDYHKMLEKRSDYQIIKQKIPNPEYLSAYLAAQIAMRETNGVNYYLRCVEDTAYYLQECYPQKKYILERVFCKYERPFRLPELVKLTRQNRQVIEESSTVSCDSIIGYLYRIVSKNV